MHGKDFVDGPVRHRSADEYRAGAYIMSRFTRSFYSRSHLPDRNSARRHDTPSNKISRVAGVQGFGSVIGLLRPRRFIFLD
jgi:hypothetical protein